MKIMNDTLLIYSYTLRATLRNPIFVMIGLFNPLCFLFLFAPLLKELTNISYFSGVNTLSIFLPGLLVMMGMYASAYAGFKIIDEIRNGFIERLWVSPVSRIALVLGRTMRDVTVLLFQAIILVLLSYAWGLEASFFGVIGALLLVVLVGITLSSCSYMLGLVFKDEEALAASINFFIVPLQLLSGITLPLALAPLWLKRTAQFNPLSHVVDGSRALFAGNFSDTSVLLSFVLMIALAAGSLYALARTYKSRAV
jgi:ABC-2 type transport system permease protein